MISHHLNPTRLTPEEFRQRIIGKGWRLADVACRWAISKEYLSRLIHNPERQIKWDDMVQSLPHLTRKERALISAERKVLRPNRSKNTGNHSKAPSSPPTPNQLIDQVYGPIEFENDGLRYENLLEVGAELIAIQELGNYAEEGDYVWITGIRLVEEEKGGTQQEFKLENAAGDSILMTPDQLEKYFCETGRTRTET